MDDVQNQRCHSQLVNGDLGFDLSRPQQQLLFASIPQPPSESVRQLALETHAASHSAHSAHSSHASARHHILLLLGDLRDHGLGGGQERRHSRSVQQSRPHHLCTTQRETPVG